LLQEKGAHVEYSDPHVPTFPRKRDYQFDLKSVSLSPSTIREFDCVILTTDHDGFDYAMLAKEAILVVDTRGKLEQQQNVVKA
jgi:UDP-N-acetyl-D-glucosamine dehydrogenase